MTDTHAQVEEAIHTNFEPSDYTEKSVVVAVPDATRNVEYDLFLTPLFERLVDVGADITAMVALGLHRPMTSDEIEPLRRVCERFDIPVVQHDATGKDVETLSSDVSEGREGWPTLPACYPQPVAGADRLICVGSVEPHQYAGFSGGIKTVAIGCAGKATIDAMHGLEFLRMPGTTVGSIDGNPFNEALWCLGDTLPPADALMFIPADIAAFHEVRFGHARDCYEACCDIAQQVFFRRFSEPLDWLHLQVTGAKSVNFYQASRAATYAALVDCSAVREGGLIVLEADCPEGIGEGRGERACAGAMQRGVAELVAELEGRAEGRSCGGQQRAFVLARALKTVDICLVGAPPIAELEPMQIPQYDTVDDALAAFDPGPKGESNDRPMHRIARLAEASC
jgi:nickel-dependent lactate racemase